MEKINKEKSDFRIKQIEIQGKKAIDSIIITYDDDTIWSFGVGGGKTYSKTVIFTEGEYLVRVTHETLENRRWAGAALELETNKGRVFSFEPVCARLPKHKRTTITADPGMEILTLKIKFGKLVGFEQQPCPPEDMTHDRNRDWYNILYYAAKEEDEDEGREFHNKKEADIWWTEISGKAREKAGRGALYLDTKHNKILKQVGESETKTRLLASAEKQGIYLDMKNDKRLTIRAVISSISKALFTQRDAVRMAIIMALLLSSDIIRLEGIRMTGQLLSIITDNQTELHQNIYANYMCSTVVSCGEGVRYDYCRAMLICFVIMVLCERLTHLGNVFIHHTAVMKLEEKLRTLAMEKAMSLDQNYHDSHTQADIDSATNVDAISRMITWNFAYFTARCVNIFAAGCYMVRLHPKFGGIVTVTTFLFKVLYLMPMHGYSKKLESQKGKLSRLANDLRSEAFSLISTVKQFSKEKFHSDEQKVARDNISCNNNMIVFIRVQREFFQEGFKYIILTAMMFYEVSQTEIHFQPGEFMTFYLLIENFLWLFGSLGFHYSLVLEDVGKIENFVDFMDTQTQVVPGKEKVDNLEGDIRFEGVHFSYPSRPGEQVLTGLDLTIQHNKMTAIVGDSGSGKSTLAKLIMRLYDPQQGKITLGGENIRKFDLAELHSKMSIVSQTPNLLNTTLSDNISYGASSPDLVSTERIKAAAALANCDFIGKFRSGMETFAGAYGPQLSGGQKQRVAIARAAMRDPDILILDEATSALDAQNEREVQDALEKLMSNKTTIVIAHRLSTIQKADEILCMKDGEVIERGSHDQLMSLGCYYANLVSKQLVEDTYKKLEENVLLEEEVVRHIMKQTSLSLERQISQRRLSIKGEVAQNKGSEASQTAESRDDEPLFSEGKEVDENDFGPGDSEIFEVID